MICFPLIEEIENNWGNVSSFENFQEQFANPKNVPLLVYGGWPLLSQPQMHLPFPTF